MSIAQKILGNTAAQIMGKIITAFIALLTVNILSSYFSASEFGDYGTVYSYLALFGAIADMGIYTLVLREMSKGENNPAQLYGTGTVLRICITALAMVLAIFLAFLIPQYAGSNIPSGVIIVSIGTFFILMSGTVSVVLQYALKMKFYQYSMVAGKLFIFFGILLVTQVFYPVVDGVHSGGDAPFYWILGLGTGGAFLIMLFTYFFSQREIALHLKWNPKELKTMFQQALPFGISMILTTFYFQMGMLFLGWLLPRSNGEICMTDFCGDIEAGKYIIALRMMEVLLYFPVFFMTSLLPTMTQAIEEKSKNIQKIFSYGFLFLFALGLPISVGGYFLATPMSSILGDEKLLTIGEVWGSDTAFSLLSLALLFAFVNFFALYALIALHRQKQILVIHCILVSVGVILNVILIPQFGLLGAAWTTLISEVCLFALLYGYLYKVQPFVLMWSHIQKIIFSCSMMGIFLFLSTEYVLSIVGNIWGLLILGSVSGGIFFLLLWWTRFLTPEMMSVIRKK